MLSDTSAVVKPLLLVKRRRSFGGANGVWWRQRTPRQNSRKVDAAAAAAAPQSSSPESSSSNDDADSLKQPSPPTNTEIETEIEWDEDLCRPIYRSTTKSPPESSNGSIISDGNESSSPTPSSPTNSHQLSPSKVVDSISKRLWIKAPIKRRNKKFGTRKRPFTCLLLHEEESSSGDAKSINSSSASINTTTPSENVKLPSKNNNNNNNNSKKNKQRRKRRRILQKDEATLQKAKHFFQQLDATQSLNVDCVQSPPLCSSSSKSSKITRTSHKMSLTSPRIQREYQAYAKASRESQVSPWSIRTYASSRRDFFRKRELFDGFLDD